MDYLYEFANAITPISKESFGLISKHLTIKHYNANTVLCNIGEKPKYGYFIKSGVIRGSIIDPKGKVFTRSLFIKDQFAGPYSALIQNTTSSFIYETLTDCEVIQLDYKEVRKLYDQNHELMRFGYMMLEFFYINMEKTIVSLATKDAKQRYIDFKNKYESVEHLIPLYQVASYLSITPIQLSRIRKSFK